MISAVSQEPLAARKLGSGEAATFLRFTAQAEIASLRLEIDPLLVDHLSQVEIDPNLG
jgi:hypothetical protein